MGHRNEFACSESNSVQSSRSKLTTCLRTQILISTATSDNCLQKLGNNLWHYFKLIFKFLSNLLLKIIINCVNTQTSMTRFWRSIIWNLNLAWSWPKNTRTQKSVPSISLVLQIFFFQKWATLCLLPGPFTFWARAISARWACWLKRAYWMMLRI